MKSNIIFLLFCIMAYGVMAQKTHLVYTADQNSNTVTVVDVDTQMVLGKITLGYPATDARIFSPLYNGDINVHGINYDPLHQKVAVVSTMSNSVTLLDALTGRVLKRAYVGRNPHEPRFTPDGRELWVTVRGENYISILDAESLAEKQRIVLSEGPGMVAFSSNGATAYVCSSFDDNFWIINVQTKVIVKTLKVPSSFSPFINVSPDGREAWVTHKDKGMVTRIDIRSNAIIESFRTGKITNHVGFAGNHYYVTIGGENKVKVYSISAQNKALLVKEIDTDALPHGIWANTERKEMYVVAELNNTLHIIDTESWQVKKTLPIGERPQALIPVTFEGSVDQLKQIIATKQGVFKGPKN